MEKRLVKIAKELSVGTSTIVEHLMSRGFEIENKPTAKITDEMYNELLKEFSKSIAIKEQADQLVIGGGRPAPKKDAPPILGKTGGLSSPTPAREEHPTHSSTPPPAAPKPEERKEEVVEERVRPQLKVLGKIDLGSRLRPGGKKEEDAAAPAAETPAAAPEKEEAVVEKPAPVAAEAPKPEPATHAAPPQEEKPAPVESPKEQTPVTAEVLAPIQETPPLTAKEIAENQVIRAEAPELRGLKILGKIDTDRLKKPKKKKKGEKEPFQKPAPAAQTPAEGGAPKRPLTPAELEEEAKKKRKRKRKKVTAPVDDNNRNNAGNRRAPQGGGGGGGGHERSGGGGNTGGGGGRRDGGGNRDGGRDGSNFSNEVSQRQIDDQIKATMARLSGGGKKKRQKMRRDNRERLRERQEMRDSEGQSDKLQITEFVSVSELANLMDVSPADVITKCLELGVIVSINQRLDAEILEIVANEFGHEVEFISMEEQVDEEVEVEDDPEDLFPRAPIVTVMGHVDHGKTSLLDYIRKANVVAGEAGGITQHIGAYEVMVNGKQITFLDTPGHEAFTAMRARGAKITDIAVIIIAADDSIMPQTREAISHAQAAGVPIVFAINKIDKAGANPDKIKQELASMNLLIEEWGGKYQSQDISAKSGLNIESLLEKILLEAELLELKANPNRQAVGTVIEASLDKGRGYVAKMLVQNGTLNIGDSIVAGEHAGKVKAMFNERGKRIKNADPSSPVLVLGLSGAPQAGERFKVMDSEQEARQIASKRAQIMREQSNRATKRISLDEIGRRLALGNFKELNLIVKGDVDGSVEALSDALIKLSIESVQVNVIHRAVGQITESDVLLASASDAVIIGFQVRPSSSARKLAEREGVQIKIYSIIYEAIEEVKAAIEGMLEPTKEERIVAQIDVREVFKVSKVGTVAGCYVQEGKITRGTAIRLVRDGIVVFPTRQGVSGEIASLKRFKDDMREVKAGLECGISIKNFNDIKVGDVIEGYEIIEIKRKLD